LSRRDVVLMTVSPRTPVVPGPPAEPPARAKRVALDLAAKTVAYAIFWGLKRLIEGVL
jgi:hypothetical protein